MAVHNNKNLDTIVDRYGSRYAATVFVSNEAKRLCSKYNDVISHSEALSWILSGEIPYNIKHYKEIVEQRSQRPLKYAKERLLDIQDQDVRHAVQVSLENSIHIGHLIYFYQNVHDTYRCSRIRILCNMIWDEMKHLGFKH